MQIYMFLSDDDEHSLPPFQTDTVPRKGDAVRLQNLSDGEFTLYTVTNLMWSYCYTDKKTQSESIVYVVLNRGEGE